MSAGLTLAIDAATYDATIALVDGTRIVAEAGAAMRGEQEERLLPAVGALLAEAGIGPTALARIVCGEGPGQFTSLRIAASIAKGIAAATDVPLHAVSSLALVVAGGAADPAPGTYLAALDAMRGEAFAAAFEVRLDASGSLELMTIRPLSLVPRDVLGDLALELGARLVGPATPDARGPHARGVARLAAQFERHPPVDLRTWEPHYGRLAEAQVKWERTHGRPLASA